MIFKSKNIRYFGDNGNKFWYKDGEFHREDGPAMIYVNGFQYWYKNGEYIKSVYR
jgi:hypothetical protein